MKLIVCAKSKRGLFIGLPSAAGYSVFSTHQPDAIKPGDILTSPTWDDEEDLFRTVRNLTNDKEVSIEIESWSMTLDEARDLLGDAGDSPEITWHPPWPGLLPVRKFRWRLQPARRGANRCRPRWHTH